MNFRALIEFQPSYLESSFILNRLDSIEITKFKFRLFCGDLGNDVTDEV